MIAVAGTIDFADRGQRDGAVAATADLQRATREQEAGCVAYCFTADPVVPTRMLIYELWADADSLAAHFEHENYRAMRTTLRGFERVGQASTMKFEIARQAPVYDATGTATASFD